MTQPQIDTTALIQLLVEAGALCADDLISKRSEKLYAFAFYTTDDLAGVIPSASSQAGFEKRRDDFFADTKQLARLAGYGIPVESALYGDYRWSAYEWEHECHMVDEFDEANRIIARLCEEHCDNHEMLSASVLAAMVIALRQLDLQSCFEVPDGRDSITIFCSKPSSPDGPWLERESARLLNPSQVFDIFAKERVSYIADDYYEGGESRAHFDRIIASSGMFPAQAHGT